MDALPYLIYAPIEKLPKEKDIIRSLKNLAKKADSIVIATDFDREGELIGSDALTCIREVNDEAPGSAAHAIRPSRKKRSRVLSRTWSSLMSTWLKRVHQGRTSILFGARCSRATLRS